MDWLNRTRLLLGDEKVEKLKNSHVLVVGLGGVGAYAAEMLCRAGIGKLTIVDGDTIEHSNINRQLPGLLSNIGKSKAQVMADRLRDINPAIALIVIDEYIRNERIIEILDGNYDYVVDAIDTLAPKTYLIYHAFQKGLRIVSSMGSGGKMNPELIKTCDISKSYNCNLARMLRKRLHKLGINKGIKVVFSPEEVADGAIRIEEGPNKKSTVGTISYMPPLFGCHIASAIIHDLVGQDFDLTPSV
jgi:tRNA A37 threonylcarbamoyladenosine dehydratase